MNRLIVALVAASLFAFVACTNTTTSARPAGETDDPKKVVATIGSEKITLGELDAEIEDQLTNLEKQYEDQKKQIRENSLDDMIANRLIAAEAARQGISEEELMANAVDGQTEPVTEEELRSFYDQQRLQAAMQGMPPDAMPPYEQIRDRMEQFLNQQKKSELAVAFVEKLKADAGVEITLVDPIHVEPIGPSKGPANAPVTIVEFSDFECPYCSRANETLDQVMETYGDQVRIVFRDFPLSFHENAKQAAEAGHCADEQGKFWEMHDKMFANQRALQVDDLKGYAQEIGLEEEKFNACLDEGKKADVVAKNIAAGEEVGITGTPAFFIDGKMLAGALPFEEFRKAIDAALLRSGHTPPSPAQGE